MDPDQANAPGALDWSRSIWIPINGWEGAEGGPGHGSTRPTYVYKRGFQPGSFIFNKRFSFFSSPSSPFSHLPNPNPNFLNMAQNWFIFGLNCSWCCSKHESFKGNCFSPLELCESFVSVAVSLNRSFSCVFFCWNPCEMVKPCFDLHSFVNLATFLWFFFEENSVRVRVLIERFKLAMDSHGFSLCDGFQWNKMEF